MPTNIRLRNKKGIFSIITKVNKHIEFPNKDISINNLISKVFIKVNEIKLPKILPK